jgi:hypothetical protein
MINLSNLSVKNLEKIQKVLEIVLDLIELQGINRLTGNKIPLKRFEKEDIFYEEVVSILNGINREEKKPVLEVLNESLEYDKLKDWSNSFQSLKELERFENERIGLEFLGFSRKDLKENIILRPKNLNLINILRENKEGVDEELKERAKTRAKEIKRQFEELNERQKAFEELGRQISSRVRKDLNIPIQYFKSYEETVKKISEQLAPLKNTLEQAGKLQSTYIKNYLTPALQRLAPYLKQAEEEMKKINEIYSSSKTPYVSKAIFSSDLIEIGQRNQIVSEVRNLRKLVEELQTKDTEKKQELTPSIKERLEIPKTFEVKVKDRYIWINNYLLSKPHAVGTNFEFFDFIRRQPTNSKITKQDMPDWLKNEIGNKRFIKILNELGFKGEVLKAFFPKRGKNILTYRGDKITKEDLEKAGVKIPLFLKELELAHLKNRPE